MADTETQQPEKHAGGRPSKYNAYMPDLIIGCGRQGMSVPEMADELDVSISTLYNWSAEHPEFLEAFTRAQELAESWWAKSLRSGLTKTPSEFQGAANLKYMAQRFKGWSEKAHVDTRSVDPADEAETPTEAEEAAA